MYERTLVLIKPDGVQRQISGEIISRFERAGLKIVGMKMVWATKDHAMKHYTEDIAIRRGAPVREKLLVSITSGPVIAICLEGVEAVQIVRKMVGDTEPRTALPGTIRGDYAHVTYAHADNTNKSVANIVHASSKKEEAVEEVKLWFKPEELHSYKVSHEAHTL